MTGQPESTYPNSPNMSTKVIQVTNIAPQTTRDQMQTLFGFVGKIEDIRLYPTVRDVSLPVQSRICYVKYHDPVSVGVAQHLTNTVFIDRALIVTPYQAKGGEIPDEYRALDIANQANVIPGLGTNEPKLPAHIVNRIEGMPPNQVITTHDPVLASQGLPPYPPLPITYDSRRIEEIRRTVMVMNVDESMGNELLEFFLKAGDVKYIRFCTRDNDNNTYALVEFSEQSSILIALQLNGSEVGGKVIGVYHSTQAISKPMAKSNEAAQKEIEEAMTRVKEAQSMISAAIDPVIGILSKDKKRSRSNSRSRRRSRSRSRRSRSRSKYRRRSRSRSHRSRRRSRSRNSNARRSRSKGRRRSLSRERHRRRKSGSRKRSRDRKRSRSRGHSKSHRRKSKERHRSRSRSKKSRSKDRQSSHSSKSKEKNRSRSRSKSRSGKRNSQSPSDRSSRSESKRVIKKEKSSSPKDKSTSPK